MSFNTSIAENIQMKVEELVEMVSGETSKGKTAHEVEEQLWRKMLGWGKR